MGFRPDASIGLAYAITSLAASFTSRPVGAQTRVKGEYHTVCESSQTPPGTHIEKSVDTIFFATNRQLNSAGQYSQNAGPMTFGWAEVQFHEQARARFFDGMDGQLSWEYGPIHRLSQADLVQRIKNRAARDTAWSKSVLVYSHGFANSFGTALCRSAEIKHRVRYEGTLLLFSWPASNDPGLRNLAESYDQDAEKIDASSAALSSLLTQLKSAVPESTTAVVAHSMGARVVSVAINAQVPSHQAARYRAVVLLAPDIDADEFKNAVLPALRQRAVRTTVYFHRHDVALLLSMAANWSSGRAGNTPLVAPGLESIDITESTRGRGELRHHADHLVNTALYDLLWNVVRGMPAECREKRGMARVENGIWVLQYTDVVYSVSGLPRDCKLQHDP